VTCYRGASLIQVRLRGDVAAGNTSGCGPRGEIVEFTPASRRRMLELVARVEEAAVPLAFTLTYPDNFPLYREDYKGHLEAFCDRMQRRWPGVAIIWKLEFKERQSGTNKGKIAPHYHLLVFGVPWRFRFKEERGESARLRRVRVHEGSEHWKEEIELNGSKQCTVMSVWAVLERQHGLHDKYCIVGGVMYVWRSYDQMARDVAPTTYPALTRPSATMATPAAPVRPGGTIVGGALR